MENGLEFELSAIGANDMNYVWALTGIIFIGFFLFLFVMISKKRDAFYNYTGRRLICLIVAALSLLIIVSLVSMAILRDIKDRAPVSVTITSLSTEQEVVFRGAMIDGLWYNPNSLVHSKKGWDYNDESSTFRTMIPAKLVLNIPKGVDRAIVFNTGTGQGNISIEISGQVVEYDLSSYEYCDTGMQIPIVNSNISTSRIAQDPNLLGAVLLGSYTLLLISLIGLFWKNREPIPQKRKRVSSVELLRFVIIMSVVVHHYCELSPNGYLGVDFFFVLSGFLLMANYKKHYHSGCNAVVQAVAYMKSRYLKIIPFYLLAFILSVILSVLMNTKWNIGIFVKNAVWELLMLEGFGITQNLFVGPGWYCSSMLIAGFLIYFFLGKNSKIYIFIIAPVSLMVVFTYMANNFGNLNRWLQVDTFISTGTLRGFAEMGLGCMCYRAFDYAKDKIRNRMKVWSSIVELMCISFILYVMFHKNTQGYDFVCVLAMAVLIISLFCANSYFSSLLSNPISSYLGKISISIYLNHIILANIDWFALLGIEWKKSFLIYLFIVVVFSCISTKFVELIIHRIDKMHIQKKVCQM